MKCKKCGTELRSDDEFCYRCGQRTTVLQRLFASKAIIGSGIEILVVAIAVVLTVLIMNGKIDLSALKINTPATNPVTVADDPGEDSEHGDSPGVSPSASDDATEEPTEAPTPTPYVFKPGNVTKQVKADLKGLTDRCRPFLAFSASFYENGSHAFKWDNVSATTMALYQLYFKDKTIKYGTPLATVEKKTKKEMKNLFGSNAAYNFTYGEYYPDYVFVKTGDTLVYNAIQIPGKTYNMDVNKIIEYKKGKYRVIVTAWLLNTADQTKGYAQKYTLLVDKNASSKYGYVIRKLKLYDKKDSKIPGK